jgi:ApeA N-terminal domain 1
MEDHFEVRGYWWLPDRIDHKVPGILKFSVDHGAELELLGSLRSLLELGDRTEGDGFVRVDMTEDALQLSGRYPRLHGEAQGKPYTLVDCFATHSSWPVFGEGGSQVINVGRILRGPFSKR